MQESWDVYRAPAHQTFLLDADELCVGFLAAEVEGAVMVRIQGGEGLWKACMYKRNVYNGRQLSKFFPSSPNIFI